MSSNVYWILELDIQSGREDDFRTLMEEMIGATEAYEPGAMEYRWSTSADGNVCHIFEHYANSAAVMVHLGNFAEKFATRFLEILSPVRFVVYGSPSQEVIDALAGFGPTYMQAVGGFSR